MLLSAPPSTQAWFDGETLILPLSKRTNKLSEPLPVAWAWTAFSLGQSNQLTSTGTEPINLPQRITLPSLRIATAVPGVEFILPQTTDLALVIFCTSRGVFTFSL